MKDCNEWKPFPVTALPPVIKKFVEEGAASIGCDPAAIALPLLAALASAIGNTRRLKIKQGWLALPVLWMVLLGKSGSQKSPAFRFAMEPVSRVKSEMFSDWKKRTESQGDTVESPLERWTVDDMTSEALADVLQANPRGLLLSSAELNSWISNFERYSKAGKSSGDAGRWLLCYDGDPIEVDRRSGDKKHTFIPTAAVCVTGTIQPATLHRSIGSEHRENGLLPRMLLAYPPQTRKEWHESEPDDETIEKVADVFRNLRRLEFRLDRFGNQHPEVLNLTPQAKETWIEFYREHAEYQFNAETDDLVSAFSKQEETTARLALVLQLARSASGPSVNCNHVDATNMKVAIELIHWFREETRRVYAL